MSEAASEPAPGSVRANAPMHAPLARPRRYSSFCPSLPKRWTGSQTSELCAAKIALVEGHAELCVAHDGARLQPVFALIDCALLESLLAYLRSGERKIDRWYARHRMAHRDRQIGLVDP